MVCIGGHAQKILIIVGVCVTIGSCLVVGSVLAWLFLGHNKDAPVKESSTTSELILLTNSSPVDTSDTDTPHGIALTSSQHSAFPISNSYLSDMQNSPPRTSTLSANTVQMVLATMATIQSVTNKTGECTISSWWTIRILENMTHRLQSSFRWCICRI